MGRKKFLIDTNLYIAAARDRKKAEEMIEFSSAFLPFLYLSSVVAMEVLVGAQTTPFAYDRVYIDIVKPFEVTKRIVTPSYSAWKEAARVVGTLRRNVDPLNGRPVRSSFWNDALIAASAREQGITIVTSNLDDFELIGEILAVDFTGPWPTS